MPCDYSKYPVNWKTEIRPRILARAGEVLNEDGTVKTEAKCEFCGIENRLEGWRFPSGRFVTVEEFGSTCLSPEDESAAQKVLKRKSYKICLTIAHLDRTGAPGIEDGPLDCPDERLAALCQKCHFTLDGKRHTAKAAERRAKRKEIGTLFSNPHKVCVKCTKEKPHSEFCKQTAAVDGLSSYCKDCQRDYMRGRESNPENRRTAAKASSKKFPAKRQARERVKDAVRAGKLRPIKECVCFDCGKPASAYDHYNGYENALDVQPCCHECHGKRSRARGEHANVRDAVNC